MSIYAEDILKILYCPMCYAHQSYLHDIVLNDETWDDVIMNFWIQHKFQLDDLPDNWQPKDTISSLIIAHWQSLPVAAHLVGGHLLREHLLTNGIDLITDIQLLKFISLPIRHYSVFEVTKYYGNTIAMGVAFILSLASNLPPALQQRLLLYIPVGTSLPTIAAQGTPDNINFIKLALKYANNK